MPSHGLRRRPQRNRAGLSCPGGFNGSVQGQQVGLFSNAADYIEDLCNVLDLFGQTIDLLGGVLNILKQLTDNLDGFLNTLRADLGRLGQ